MNTVENLDSSRLQLVPESNGEIEQTHVLFITGFASPEIMMRPLASRVRRLSEENIASHHVDHALKVNVIYGMKRHVKQTADQLVDEYGPIDIVGLSLGGKYGADYAKAHPGSVRKLVTIASPIHDFYGVSVPESTYATSFFSYTDVVVPWWQSINTSFAQHKAIPFATHFGIVGRRDLAKQVYNELVTAVPDKSSRPKHR